MTTEIKKQTILIVEDETSLMNALHDKLNHEGFSTLEARDGEEGLNVALREHPDLILLDIVMPKMDGMTMMKRLRQTDAWGKGVPIILLTNLSGADDKINQGITEDLPAYYLIKSDWKISDVVEKIRERLSQQN